MDDSDVIISSTEIIKDRLYFATLKTGYKPKATRNSKYFHIEDEIVYENFYFDFGPYHLCHLYQFCVKLNKELEENPKKKIVFYTSNTDTLRLNAAYLIGSYQVCQGNLRLFFFTIAPVDKEKYEWHTDLYEVVTTDDIHNPSY